MSARIQTWLPFSIQICVNGREWLARSMDAAGLHDMQRDNCFPWLEHPERAQHLMDQQLRSDWPVLLSGVARSLNPLHETIFCRVSHGLLLVHLSERVGQRRHVPSSRGACPSGSAAGAARPDVVHRIRWFLDQARVPQVGARAFTRGHEHRRIRGPDAFLRAAGAHQCVLDHVLRVVGRLSGGAGGGARNDAYVPRQVPWIAPHAVPIERDDPIRLQIDLGKAAPDVSADQQHRFAPVVRAELSERLGKEQQITQPVRGDNGDPPGEERGGPSAIPPGRRV
jgi:hypothetical protein